MYFPPVGVRAQKVGILTLIWGPRLRELLPQRLQLALELQQPPHLWQVHDQRLLLPQQQRHELTHRLCHELVPLPEPPAQQQHQYPRAIPP